MAFDPQRLYSVIRDRDGLHIVPAYRVIPGGKTLLSCESLASCATFAGTYLTRIAAGHGENDAAAPSPPAEPSHLTP